MEPWCRCRELTHGEWRHLCGASAHSKDGGVGKLTRQDRRITSAQFAQYVCGGALSVGKGVSDAHWEHITPRSACHICATVAGEPVRLDVAGCAAGGQVVIRVEHKGLRAVGGIVRRGRLQDSLLSNHTCFGAPARVVGCLMNDWLVGTRLMLECALWLG